MIKKIIFDLDNTLIFWKDEYIFALKEVLKKYNITDEKTIKLVDYYIEEYEKDNETLSNNEFLDYINRKTNLEFDISFVEDLIEKQKECFDEPKEELIEVLDYLSKKYELIVHSNWFTQTQKGRLKNAGLLKYFKEVYGGEGYLKPHPKSFLKSLDGNSIDECIYVGDSLDIDIKGALNIGMKVVLYNYKNKDIISDRFIVINDLTNLKEIL